MRFVSYNIQYSRGKDRRYDLERIARTVAEADVICLQEVERNAPRTGMEDQPARLRDLLPDYYASYTAAFDVDASTAEGGRVVNRRRQFGNMLLARTPILAARHHLLPKFDAGDIACLQRGALEGVIATPTGLLRVFTLHLGHAIAEERLLQVAALRAAYVRGTADGWPYSGGGGERAEKWLGGEPPRMPQSAVLLGDYNFEPHSAEYAAMTAETEGVAFVDAWTAAGHSRDSGVTCPRDPENDTPHDMRIDYGFVTPDLAGRVTSARIDNDADASDHQPVWIEIDLSESGG